MVPTTLWSCLMLTAPRETALMPRVPPSLQPPTPPPATTDEKLSCRVVGFYPFPKRAGPLAWLFRDTHQAVDISCGSDRLFADFMTAGGGAHPVWWDDGVKWHVLLGGSIEGEVRMKNSGECIPGSKLERLRTALAAYDCRMNIYTNSARAAAAPLCHWS